MDRKKIMYIGIIFIITVISSITYFSYGFLTSKNEYHGRVNMVVGTLDYELKSSDLDSNNSITLNANETKKIEIEITSLNTITSKYELYYQTESNDVEIGYSSDTVDNPTGELGSKNSKKVTVVIKNKSNTSATVTFGAQGGFTYNNITLEEGRIAIDEELNLCAYNPGDVVKEAGYTGSADPFEVPCDGNYKIELWGANSIYDNLNITYGAYVSGNILLNRSEKLYAYVGGQGKKATTSDGTTGGGYNGGGNAGYYAGSWNDYTYGGGGATDIRYFGNNYTPTVLDLVWNSSLGLNSRIMVAAASSGGSGYHGGGIMGYEYPTYSGGKQTTGYAFGYGETNSTAFGGGSGYYGGSTLSNGCNGASGSSFISGHTGCVAIAEGSTTEPRAIKIDGCTTGSTDIECSKHYSGLIFTNTKMIDGAGYNWTNVKGSLEAMPNPNGGYYASGTGHIGNGYARITYLGNERYTITFNTNGGNSIENRTVLQGNTIGVLPTPTRGTDIFEGWYLDSSFTTKIDNTYVPTESITLYARYGVEVNMNLTGRSSGTPSNTTSTNTTKRTWNTNTYVNKMAANNYYSGSFFTSSSFGTNSVTVASGCGYGVVIPMSLEKGKTYVITTGHIIAYASDGTYIGALSAQNTTIGSMFTVPSNANWVLFHYGGGGDCTTTGAKVTTTYSNIHLYKLD